MLKSARIGSAISAVALASAIAGCAAPQGRVAAASSFGGKADGDVGLATRALAALSSNDVPLAIDYAERAVAKTPNDAGFRALLGNGYFAAGRFASAEAAYKDSLSIYSNQPQVVLKLALVDIAQGKTSEASAFLDAARSVLDPADYGLALALAGHPGEAAQTLRAAARDANADARVRQNLALAYALAGDWNNARAVAAQDLSADQVDGRIQQWMQLARPGHPSDQIAALTGVKPAAADPGQPMRLALRKPDAGSAVAVAVAQPQPQSRPVAVTEPQPQPRPVAVAAPLPRPVAVPQPEPQAEIAPSVAPPPPPPNPARVAAAQVAQAAPPRALAVADYAPPAPVARPAFTPAAAPVRKPARLQHAASPVRSAALARGRSSAVVQLGAYGSPQRVLAAWNAAALRHSALRNYAPMSARFNTGRGTVYRLSVRGFASNGEASVLCAALRRGGGSCFVRTLAGDAPVQFASR